MTFRCGKWGGLSFAWWVLTLGNMPPFEHCCEVHDDGWYTQEQDKLDCDFYWCMVDSGLAGARWAEVCYWIIRRYRAITGQY